MDHMPLTPQQQGTVKTLFVAMISAGVITIMAGALGVVASLVEGIASRQGGIELAVGLGCGAVIFLLPVVMGVWLIQGGLAFRLVLDTDDADQENLIVGLEKIRNFFVLKSLLVVLLLGFVALTIVMGGMLAALLAMFAASGA